MDTELAAIPLVTVGDRESHHADTGFEVRHAAGDPMIDGAGTRVEASGDLLLAYPGARRPLTEQFRIAGQGGAKNSGTRKPGLRGTHRNRPWTVTEAIGKSRSPPGRTGVPEPREPTR